MRARVLCLPLLLLTSLALARPAGTVESSFPPPDVDAALRLHAPPHVEVEVRTVNAPPKKDGPCKDPICLGIVLTFMAFEKAFPKQYDVVTVTVEGKPRFHGSYEVGGHFLYGYIESPEGARRFERLELPQLRRTLIVETGRFQPRLPVEELLADYRKALAATQYEPTRQGLLTEALWALREPALPLVRERLADPAESDEVKASVLASGCDARGSRPLELEHVRTLLDAAQRSPPGPETLAATVECRLERKQPLSRELIGALVAGFCRAECLQKEGRAYTVLSHLRNEGSPSLDPAPLFADSCESPARRAVLRTCLGTGAVREEYAAAFTAKDGSGKAVLQCLQKDRPEHRVGFEEDFRAAPYERLAWVEGRDTPLEAWELEALARDFPTPGVRPYWRRAWVVDQFARVAGDPERTAPARAVLREWVRKTEREHQAVKAKEGDVMRFLRGVQDKVVGPGSNDLTVTAGIALMALGEWEETPRAALGLPREPRPIAQTAVDNEFELAQYAFTRVGCTRAEMQSASTLLHAGKPLTPGAWCASQKQGR